MPFDVKTFVDSPSIEKLNNLKKSEVIKIIKHYNIDCDRKMRKDELKKVVAEYLIDENLCEESDHDKLNLSINFEECDNTLELRKLELQAQKEKEEREMQMQLKLKEMEMQKEREKEKEERDLKLKEMEIQKEKEERDLKLKEMEIQKELELKELEFQAHTQRPDSSQNRSDIARYSSLIPKFDEKNVEVFFTQFETQMDGLGLAKEKWAFLLRSALTGKALEAICTLSVEQGSDYEFLKKTVLAAYQLVPEAYRQKFRSCKKQESQTYVKFTRQKELLFDKLCHSKKVSDFKDLKQLMLVEEFQRCVGEDVKTYLTGQKVNDLTTAAVTADEYALLHKPKQSKSDKKFYKQSSNIPNQNSFGNKNANLKNGQNKPNRNPNSDNMHNSIPTCAYCHKKGHVMSKCFKLAQSKKDGEVSTNALTVLGKSDKSQSSS